MEICKNHKTEETERSTVREYDQDIHSPGQIRRKAEHNGNM